MNSSRSSSAFAPSRLKSRPAESDKRLRVKILVEPSAHHLQNMGDVAMLTVAVGRLRRLWPEATIGVLANDPDRLRALLPGVVFVPAAGRRLWLDDPLISARLHGALPRPIAGGLRELERRLRTSSPRIAAATIRRRRRLKDLGTGELDAFLKWVTGADLVVVVGAGLLTDAFATAALTVLELLESAAKRGAGTAMMGQGVGPLTGPSLTAAARRVLPSVGLICLREQRAGRPILRDLGVSEDRMVTTGDDAIELAFAARPQERQGSALGLSLRVARYSEVDEQHVSTVGSVIRRVGYRYGAELVPLPISNYFNERDAEVIAAAIGATDGRAEPPETPMSVIERIHRCRVVVTGSYHAAVFALAQGIPAVGLAGSEYYVDKFLGLADQFDGHSWTVMLEDPDLDANLEKAMTEAWSSADQLAPKLVAAAERQLQCAEVAMDRLRSLVGHVPAGTP
jgi:polysaccharide pyruvyl transferase WcaK-like protein